MTTFQTKAINIASFVIVISSVFAGIKFVQYNTVKSLNEELIERINRSSIEARTKSDKNTQLLSKQIEQLRAAIDTMENFENQRIQEKLESEKILLQKKYEEAYLEKSLQIESEMIKFQSDFNGKLRATESILTKIDGRLKHYFQFKEDQKDLEKICQMIIEDDIEGQFDNCYSLKVLRKEFQDVLPIVKKYYIMNSANISTLKYFFTNAVVKLMFSEAPMGKFDVLSELNLSVKNGDLHKALFLFDSLTGWPRLILKNWAEKCRMRLDFIQKVKSQLYSNKI